MRFDTHLHVWWPGDGAAVRIRSRIPELDRDFSLARVRPALVASGVSQVILVSAAQQEDENERLLAVARENADIVAGVIGWLDLEAPDVAKRTAHHRKDPGWLGVRLPLTIHPDRRFISRAVVLRGLEALRDQGAVAQFLAGPDQLADVAAAIGKIQGLRAIIDHAGTPEFSAEPTILWKEGIADLARLPDTVCKVSAFWNPGDPPVSDEKALLFFSYVAATFGPHRMIAAANWPPSSLAGPYEESWNRLDRLADAMGLCQADRRAISEVNGKLFLRIGACRA
jgi:L-fuconolactonase